MSFNKYVERWLDWPLSQFDRMADLELRAESSMGEVAGFFVSGILGFIWCCVITGPLWLLTTGLLTALFVGLSPVLVPLSIVHHLLTKRRTSHKELK